MEVGVRLEGGGVEPATALGDAVERMADGASLTEAAHEAGFADSAHFSRTFRRMFGLAPSSLRIG